MTNFGACATGQFSSELVPDEIHCELEEAQVYGLWEQLAISHVYRLQFRRELVQIWNSGEDIAESVDSEADQLEPLLPLMESELELVRLREASLLRLKQASDRLVPDDNASLVEVSEEVHGLTAQVVSRLEAWVRRHQRPFLYGGVDYLEWARDKGASAQLGL